ncbi:arginase [Deltaproteobacteria bacterium Smac51]|nr:arginase [Deltaproteobacteria bacterium Smac51]
MQTDKKTLRLLMPQWQGGNNGITYPLGARLLAWLAPESDSPLVEVPVEPFDGSAPPLENGVVWRTRLLKQLRASEAIIKAYEPDRIVNFGGDCLVSQAPFAWLNERYQGELGVLWIDAHPDVTTPKQWQNAHAMVLGHLLGEGDADFTAEVKVPLKPRKVMLAGIDETSNQEAEVIKRLGLRVVGQRAMAESSAQVLDWIGEAGIKHLAIHLDLDILDPKLFRSLLFAEPQAAPDAFKGIPQGHLTFTQVGRLISDISARTDVVGLSIAEHMPWDDIHLQDFLKGIPILNL